MGSLFRIMSESAKSAGFIDMGVAKVEKLDNYSSTFEKYLNEGMCASMEYLKKNLDKRLDPSLLLDNAKSVLCFLAPYGGNGDRVASFALGKNYHTVLKNKLFPILKQLESIAPECGVKEFIGRMFVDSAPLLERAWAIKSGLGFIGCNNFLISPQYGLRTLIGVILCNIPFDFFDCEELRQKCTSQPEECGSCGKCIEACPTGALHKYSLDARKCISYHTIESKELYDKMPVDFAGQIFGCEKCLTACPWNKKRTGWPEFETNAHYILGLNEQQWLEMTQEEFDNRFKDSPLKRAGLEKIKNSILINKK